MFNFTSRRRTGAMRSRATLPLPLPLTPPPLGVPVSVVVPTPAPPTTTVDAVLCAAAADAVEPRTGVVVATALAAIGACCGANSDEGCVNGVDGGSASCPGADRLGMDIGLVGLVLVGVVVVVVGSGGGGSNDGGGKGGGGGAGDTEGEVPIRPRPVNGVGDECRPGHRDEGVCTFAIDDGGMPPTAGVGGMCSPTCCCGSAHECNGGGGGGGGGGSCGGGGGGVETARGMVVKCGWHDDDMLARVLSFLSVLLRASLLMESRASLRLLWLFWLSIMVGVMAGLVKVRLVEVGTSLTMFSADAGDDCERGSIGLAVYLWCKMPSRDGVTMFSMSARRTMLSPSSPSSSIRKGMTVGRGRRTYGVCCCCC